MDLTAVRSVKRELESLFATRKGPSRKFALGVAMPTTDAGYRIAVRAATKKDLPESSLAILRRQTAGELDVQFVGRISASRAHELAISRGPAIGASVAHSLGAAGTLGFFARRVSDGSIGFVSNNHVLAAEDRGQDSDEIFHPAPIDCPLRTHNPIGFLAGGYPRLKRTDPIVDCAFAQLVEGTRYNAASLYGRRKIGATPVKPNVHRNVCKIGRTTGLTYGRITAFEMDPLVHYSFWPIHFRNQIEIESVDSSRFSKGGDSGSLVFTQYGSDPVALVFAASLVGGHANRGLTYANPIDAVLRALGVTLLA
jgi:hypothetical protein